MTRVLQSNLLGPLKLNFLHYFLHFFLVPLKLRKMGFIVLVHILIAFYTFQMIYNH